MVSNILAQSSPQNGSPKSGDGGGVRPASPESHPLTQALANYNAIAPEVREAQLRERASTIGTALHSQFITSERSGREFWDLCKVHFADNSIYDHGDAYLVAERFFALAVPAMDAAQDSGNRKVARVLLERTAELLCANFNDTKFQREFGSDRDISSWHSAFYKSLTNVAHSKPPASIELDGIWRTLFIQTAVYLSKERAERGRLTTSQEAGHAHFAIREKLRSPAPESILRAIEVRKRDIPLGALPRCSSSQEKLPH